MELVALNVFQRIMRLWDAVHPYNAAQVLRLQGSPDREALSTAWAHTLATLGLGQIHVDGTRYRHESCNGQAHGAVQFITGESLDDLVSREMNRRFDLPQSSDASFCPFRPLVREDDGYYDLVVIYHHWVADSASVRTLMREWFYRLFHPSQARSAPLAIAREGYWRLFGPSRAGWSLGDSLLSAARMMTRFTNTRRVVHPSADYQVRCSIHPLADGLIDRLCTRARKLGVTLNDLFLAATARACHRHGVNSASPGRQELALGTVVDLRNACADNLDDVFGLFLGFTTVILRADVLEDWPRLLRTIARQNAWQKRCRTAQASQIRMAAAVAESFLLSPQTWVRYYQGHLPLAAGISNVNLNRSWAAPFHPFPIIDYFRFSPTGPAIPLLFTPSSLGRRAHLALTCRHALVDPARAARVVQTFVAQLEAVAAETADPSFLTGAPCP